MNGWKRAREGNTVELCGACALRRHGRVLCDIVRWAWFYFKDKNTEAVAFERGSKRLDLIEGPILLSYSEGRRWRELQVSWKECCGPFVLIPSPASLLPLDHPSQCVQPALGHLSSICFFFLI